MYLQHNVGRKWRKLLQKGFKLTFNLENVVLLSIIIFFKKTEKCYWRKITVKYHFESRLNLHNLQHTLISLVAPSCVGRNITFRTFEREVFFSERVVLNLIEQNQREILLTCLFILMSLRLQSTSVNIFWSIFNF